MNNDQIMNAILKHGLAIRQIPLEVISIYEIRHLEPSDEIVQHYNRPMCKRVRIPKHAGYWMSKQFQYTASNIIWDLEEDNLAPTLGASIELFLNKAKL